MQTNDHKIRNYSAVLEKKYGISGSPERVQFDEEAYSFYTSQILREARREAKLTQSELASRIGATKSYISKLENGYITPSVGTFYRLINALGMRIEIVKPIGL